MQQLNKEKILQLAKQDPRFAQAVLTIEQKTQDMSVEPENLSRFIALLEFAINNPNEYSKARDRAVQEGLIEAEDIPEQFDPVFLVSVLVALYGLQERGVQKAGFAKGGLAHAAKVLRAKGRNGDTILAHINPSEAALLRSRGGSGRINPNTGLPEFGDFSTFLRVAIPVALAIIAPGVGGAIGSALTGGALAAGGVGAGIVGGAAIGGGMAALTGGNVTQGAAMGGLSAGLGGVLGGGISDAGGFGLGAVGKAALGSGLVGGAMGAASGKGFAEGAAQGALGSYLGGQLGTGGAMGAAGNTFSSAMGAGYSPKESVIAGGLAGVASAFMPVQKPSEAVVKSLSGGLHSSPNTGTSFDSPDPYALSGPAQEPGVSAISKPTFPELRDAINSAPTGGLGALAGADSPFTLKNAMLATTAASMLEDAPEEAKTAVAAMTPQQKEMFNRPNVTWDWGKMRQDASASNMSLAAYMSQNWPRITGYAKPGGDARQGQYAVAQPRFAMGGLAALAAGGGSGRDDTIDARLSDGEYVFDAETVALLGDGSNKEGARRLDQMRAAIRSHKGQRLSKGKISPDAKDPMAYIKGVA